MKKFIKNILKLLIFVILPLHFFVLRAQDYPYAVDEKEKKEENRRENVKTSLSDRIYFGGNFNLLFGLNTIIELSPIVGYRITDEFSVGGGLIYTYFRRQITPQYSVSGTGYGGRAFARYDLRTDLLRGATIAPYAEYESLNYEFRDSFGITVPRRWYGSLFVGAGLIQPIGRGSINIFLLYNLTWQENSIYPTPFVYRVGFNLW